jgi:hypothetical protein
MQTTRLHQRVAGFLGLKKNMLALLAMAILVGLGEKMAERFLPLYLMALGGGGGGVSHGVERDGCSQREMSIAGWMVCGGTARCQGQKQDQQTCEHNSLHPSFLLPVTGAGSHAKRRIGGSGTGSAPQYRMMKIR